MKGKYLIITAVLAIGGILVLYISLRDGLNLQSISQSSLPVDSRQPDKRDVSSTYKDREYPSWVEQVRIVPGYPLVIDDVKADVKLHKNAPVSVELNYEWFVNEKPLSQNTEAKLPKGIFKKYDRINVRITPMAAGIPGAPVISSIAIVMNSAPDISLDTITATTGDVTVLLLKGFDPDGDKLSYALDPPVPSGMAVDEATGKITWKPESVLKGPVKITATVKDSDGAKTTKTFEVNIGRK